MRPAILSLYDLSRDEIHELARLLSRRPNYGIARPSGRWLKRQEQKIDNLPKSLLNSKSTLSRLAIGLATKFDKKQKDDNNKILPPSAMLCNSHERLNSFLLRNIFLALIREVSGDHVAAIRNWPGKSPAVAAFLTRIDSLHALWVSKEAFRALFGTQPLDDRYVRVQNNCEACILSAIGANGQILADLHGWFTVRREECKKYNKETEARVRREKKKKKKKKRRKKPLGYRLVEAWIKHLEPNDQKVVRQNVDTIANELLQIWPAITKLRRDVIRDDKRSTYQELCTRSNDMARVIEVASRPRSFDNPLPKPGLEAATLRRNMAGHPRIFDFQSVYRADTVIDGSVIPTGSLLKRPGAPEPQQVSGALSVERPHGPFINYFASEVPFSHQDSRYMDDDDELYEKDATYDHEYDERDYAAEAESVIKVQRFFQSQAMGTTNTDLDQLDPESVHPAFQSPVTSHSTGLPPFHVNNKGSEPPYAPARANWLKSPVTEETTQDATLEHSVAKSEWTDVSVCTTVNGVDVGESQPTPIIPQRCRAYYNAGNRTPTAAISSTPSRTPSRSTSMSDLQRNERLSHVVSRDVGHIGSTEHIIRFKGYRSEYDGLPVPRAVQHDYVASTGVRNAAEVQWIEVFDDM